MSISASSSTNTSSGSTPANSDGARSAIGWSTLTPPLPAARSAGGSRTASCARPPAGPPDAPPPTSSLRRQLDAVVAAGHARDRLLHQRPAEIVDAPVQRLGGGVEAHLDPARLEVGDGLAEREPERRGVLEVLLAGDLLDPVGAAEQRVERDERQRHELGEAAGALLELAHHAHVLGELPRLLDVAEHHGHGRADPLRMRRLDDLDPPRHRQLVGRDPLADAVVEHLGGRARRRAEAGLAQPVEHRARRQAADVAHVRDLHRRVRVQVELAGPRPWRPAATSHSPRRPQSGWIPDCMQISVAPNSTASWMRWRNSSSECS